ncbi:hypothetical protein N2152v2_007943 [Parachlorella kessleri]
MVWCEPAVEQLEGSAAADQSPQAGASAERVPSGDALPTATPVLQQPAAAVSPIHTRSVVHSELFHLSEVLETSLAMNASLEAELTAVRQEVEQARADAETYRSKLAQLTQQVQNALLPDAKPGDKACTNMSLLLRRFQSRLSNVRAAAASWKAKAMEAAAGDVEKAREEAAEQAGVADRLLASLRRRFGDDWQKGMDARSKQLRRMKARVGDLEQQLARSMAQQAISGAAATNLEAQLTELEREKQQLRDEELHTELHLPSSSTLYRDALAVQQLRLKAASQAVREGGYFSIESDAAKIGNCELLTLLIAAAGKQLAGSSDGEPPRGRPAERYQRQARERQQEEKQRQQQEKQERRQQKQQQQQQHQQQPQEQDLAVPMPAVEPTRQQPGRTCKRTIDGGLAGAQQSSVDPEQCSETQAPVDKRPRA